ncbi:non-specific lipid-transfer protein-like protein At2g13820 isoform X3 [Papaver somniferum]|uniref:non-specific lipid-transfer protein-like protein At2g13820 isoform X3 n=1 Tax=Papaver somniferum TaxID=3469 RepID=UPI000E6FF6F2|nr:non-specific lipid-transfer protein-like protein At2g13820 isoform X3 [Papaver somniferum]
MAFKGIQVCSVALLTALLFAVAANAQSDCTNVIISLSPCLNYLTGNSSTPSSDCCSQLSTVVRSKPECLCQVLNGDDSSLAGLNIKKTQALGLPKACNVQTPSISKCNYFQQLVLQVVLHQTHQILRQHLRQEEDPRLPHQTTETRHMQLPPLSSFMC